MSRNRVTFFSKYDGAGFRNMEMAEEILINFDENKDYDINDIIELYQIKLYIENEVFLTRWTTEQTEEYKSTCKKMWSVIVRFWNKIESSNFIEIFQQLECWTLEDSFWELTANLAVYKQISTEAFGLLIKHQDPNVVAILHQEKIVNYYGMGVRDLLFMYDNSAELILTQYVEKHDRDRKDLYFPKCLSLKDKEDIIFRYIDSPKPNLNYVQLAYNTKKQAHLDLSDETKLKARRIEKKISDEYYNSSACVGIKVEISFVEDQEVPRLYSFKDNVQSYSYSRKYLFLVDHSTYYLSHFCKLFHYLDNQSCISLVNHSPDLGTMEKIAMKSKNEYYIGYEFDRKNFLSYAQLEIFNGILVHENKNSVEQLIEYYIVKHIEENFNLSGFRFKLPSEGTNYLEKITVLLPQFDAFLRQYKLYFEKGEIDYELLQISSTPYSFSQIPSFVSKKYCYIKSDYFDAPFRLLFSDQSGLYYVKAFAKKNYHCLFDLLRNEQVALDNFAAHQMHGINYLIENGYLAVDENTCLKFKDNAEMFIFRQLYKKEVLSYWHYDEEYRAIIDIMADKGQLEFESTLFNRLECDYFNYYLNKKDFTNGIDLRNSFMHGTNPDSEGELKNYYILLLRIIVLTILKVDDDLGLRKRIFKLV